MVVLGELDSNWLIGFGGAAAAVITAAYAGLQSLSKARAEAQTAEANARAVKAESERKTAEGAQQRIAWLFERYEAEFKRLSDERSADRELVKRVQEEHKKLADEHVSCREETAAMKEKLRYCETRIVELENRLGS